MDRTEILEEIKKAEEKVRAMAREAEEKRRQLKAEGKRRALEIIGASESSMRVESDSKIATAKADIDLHKKAILDEGAKRAEALAANARRRMTSTKEFVLSEFERATDA